MAKNFYPPPDAALRSRKLKEYKSLYIDPYFPADKNAKILDLACGGGIFLEACSKAGYKHIEGVELNDGLIDYGRNELKLNIIKADIFSHLDSAKESSYDIITAFNIIEHVKKEKVHDLLDLIYRAIKPGGKVYIEVPNGDSPIGIHTYFSDLTHEFAYSPALMTRILRMSGFEDIKIMPNRVRSNLLIRAAQKVLAKIVGFDDKIMFSGNIIAIAGKK